MRKIRVAKYINEYLSDDPVSSQTVINWIKSGELKGAKRGGIWQVHVDDVYESMAYQTPKDECLKILMGAN
jgi:predicted site-specific integrase-resolvase